MCTFVHSHIHLFIHLFNKHLFSMILSFSDYRKTENWGNFGKCRDERRKKKITPDLTFCVYLDFC